MQKQITNSWKKSHSQTDTFSHFNICHIIWNGFQLGRKTFDTEQFYVNNLTNFSWKDLENSFKQKPLSFFSESNSFYVSISILVSSTARTKKCVQGVSCWSMQSKLALRGRRIKNFIELWCLVASEGLEICVSSTSFQKDDIGRPQQPPTERISDISEKLDFWWSIPQKGTGIGHLGARDDQTIRISRFFNEMRLSRSLRPLRLLRPLRSLRLQRF